MLALDVVQEMNVVGSAQDDHSLRCRGPLEELVHAGQWRHDIVFGDQIQGGNVATPCEGELSRQDPRFWTRAPSWRQGNHSADAPLDGRGGKRRPATEAVPHDSDPCGIQRHFRVPRRSVQQIIKEEADIGHAARDQSLHARRLLLVGLTIPSRELRRDHFGVIQGRDDIPVAAQVSAHKSGHASGTRGASVRKND
ncbi:MAG TPA: hypothetical protein VN375_07570 [Vicinamibacteria bacterium]|nr:hypothetical protein [Vicinamibacteria bacterium]